MTIRTKIFSALIALLSVFAVAFLLTTFLVKESLDEFAGIAEYHQKLAALLGDIDVLTFEYELVPRRLLGGEPPSPQALQAASKRAAEIADRLAWDMAECDRLLAQATSDPRNAVGDRLVLAKVQGAFAFLRRSLPPFLDVGRRMLGALAQGQAQEAQAAALHFYDYIEIFGPDTARIRHQLEQLTARSTHNTNRHQRGIVIVNLVLFVLATLLGVVVFSVVTGRLQRAFHRLVKGVRAVAVDHRVETLPVTSRDEIGELTGSFNEMVEQIRSKEKLKDTFGKFVDPRIVAGMLDASGEARDTAERRQVTVFFSDIQGFTSIGEQLTADTLVRLLNHYFTVAGEIIRQHNGIIDKYIGDAVMAFWAAPFSQGDTHAAEACLAALEQQRAFIELRGQLSQIIGLRRNLPSFAVRMGLATGEVVIGTVGSATSKSFTVVGDTVNTAARLEGVNKVYGTSILLNEGAYRLAQNTVEVREIDLINVVGKSEPVRIYELLGPHGKIPDQLLRVRDAFAEGLAAYRERRWNDAERAFLTCLDLRSEDGPSRELIQRVVSLRNDPPPDNWNGVYQAKSK